MACVRKQKARLPTRLTRARATSRSPPARLRPAGLCKRARAVCDARRRKSLRWQHVRSPTVHRSQFHVSLSACTCVGFSFAFACCLYVFVDSLQRCFGDRRFVMFCVATCCLRHGQPRSHTCIRQVGADWAHSRTIAVIPRAIAVALPARLRGEWGEGGQIDVNDDGLMPLLNFGSHHIKHVVSVLSLSPHRIQHELHFLEFDSHRVQCLLITSCRLPSHSTCLGHCLIWAPFASDKSCNCLTSFPIAFNMCATA